MARRRTQVIEEDLDPVEGTLLEERQRQASSLSEALEGLDEFESTGASFKVYKMPRGGGTKYEWCMDIQPPFDSAELLTYIKDKWGPGDYCIRVYVSGPGGGSKAQRNFSIAQELRVEKPQASDLGMKEFLPLMLQMMQSNQAAQQQSADRQMQMMLAMMTNNQQAMAQAQQAQATMLTAVLGSKEKPAEILASLAPFMPKEKATGFGEFAEMLKTAKELMGGNTEKDLTETLIDGAAKALPALMEGLRPPPQHVQLSDITRQPGGNGVSGRPMIEAPSMETPVNTRFPVLSLIRQDVLFYFTRGMEPDFAAEGIFEVLQKSNVTEADLAGVVIAFQSSANWLDDLAAEGIDLRTNPVWATEFLNGLVALYRGEDDHTGGSAGGSGHAHDNGAAGAMGQSANAGQEQGAGAD